MIKQNQKLKLNLLSVGLLPMLLMVNFSGQNLLKNIADTTTEKSIISKTSILADSYYDYQDQKIGVEFGDKNKGNDSAVKFSTRPNIVNEENNNQEKSIAWQIKNPDLKKQNWLARLTKNIGDNLGGRFAASSWQIKQGEALLAEVLPDVDLRYQILPDNGLKEELIVKGTKEIVADKYYFDLTLDQGVKLQKAAEGNKFGLTVDTYYFTDADDNYVAHFRPIMVYDSNKQTTSQVQLEILPVKNNSYQIIISIDHDWLYNTDRQYPIFIDPTIVHDTLTEFNAGTVMNRVEAAAGPKVQLNNQELAADVNTVSLWHMDETSGTTVTDLSGRGNNGTASGTTIVDGKIGKARSFNGTSDYISVPDSDDYNLTSSDGGFEAWVKPYSYEGSSFYGRFLAQETGVGGNWLSYFRNYNFCIGIWGSSELCSSGITLNTNNWYQIAVYKQGGTTKIYINGIERGSGTGTYFNNSSLPLTIGKAENDNYFNGIIDEMKFIKGRSPSLEEIKADYQLQPYGIYTSEVLNLNSSNPNFNNFNWTENGVRTGDGETDFSTVNLVAQWNFNETNGTTATNNAGSCGSQCNGTLTGFSNTSGQDVAAGSGWTGDNKKWGTGAIMLPGNAATYIHNGSSSYSFSGSITVESWFKANSCGNSNWPHIFNYYSPNVFNINLDCNQNQYEMWLTTPAGTYSNEYNRDPRQDFGKWNHIVAIFDDTNDTTSLYLNGQLMQQTTGITGTPTFQYFNMGNQDGQARYFDGTIDSTRVYNRVLSINEILSNYQAGNVQFQTRTGTTTNPEDGSWEEWRPSGNNPSGTETNILNLDGPYLYNTTDTGLIGYWPLDEESGSTANDRKGSNNGTATGTKIIDGKFSKARYFNGSSDYIANASPSGLPAGQSARTIEAWINPANLNPGGIIASLNNATGSGQSFILSFGYFGGNTYLFTDGINGNNNITVSGNEIPPAGSWSHIVFTFDGGSAWKYYLNGLLIKSGNFGTTINTSVNTVNIGRRGDGGNTGVYWPGSIDEVRIYNSDISASTVYQHFMEGIEKLGIQQCLSEKSDSNIKQEGSASDKITTGAPTVDANTVALWHLDETGGTGAYIKDSSGNGNDGTPSGTSVTSGISNKARNFNGSSNYIQVTDSTSLKPNQITVSAWVKPTAYSDYSSIIMKSSSAAWGDGYGLAHYTGSDNNINFFINNYSSYKVSGTLTPNVWSYVVGTYDGSNIKLYINESLIQSVSYTGSISHSAQPLFIGMGAGGNGTQYLWNGKIDEAKIDNVARTADEIAESYRMGRDHLLNRTISATDLSSKSLLPFYIAADKPGTYLSTTIGESAFANYLPDGNTVGLWHLEEAGGSGAYIKDSSGNANHGTPAATTVVDGKIGQARSFNGSSDYITFANANLPTGSNQRTMSAWIKMSSGVSGQSFFGYGDNSYSQRFGFWYDSNGLGVETNGYAKEFNWTNDSNWHYLVAVFPAGQTTSDQIQLYLDGQLKNSTNYGSIQTLNTTATNLTMGRLPGVNGYYYGGLIDEGRIDNIAHSANDIRQAYEIGLRTHLTTIDFAASLDSGNLITGSGDTSFTIDATTKGISQKGGKLFVGEKVIIRENYDGTEYIAQGSVDSINISTGAVTVNSWESASTFPTGGFTTNADVFKWQREYFDLSSSLSSQRDAITNITTRITDGSEGHTIWLDDFESVSNYLTNPETNTINSTPHHYFQYRFIPTTIDKLLTPSISMVNLDYSATNLTIVGGSTDQLYLNNNNKNNFNIGVNGILSEEADATVTAQASWNQSNWYDLDQTVGPVNDITLTGNPDVTSWVGYPTDGEVPIYVRAKTAANTSNVESFNINKDTTKAVVTNITSVAGDETSPFNDASDDGETLVVYTASTDAAFCRWDNTDVSYASMPNTCTNTTSCTLNLTGTGTKNIYMRCKDNAGNEDNDALSPSPTFSYQVGGISINSASTDQTNITNLNKNSFNILANNVIYETASSTVTAQGSWNQTDWYDITTVASPVNNSTVSGLVNITSWNGYPADGTVTIYVRGKGGTSDYSNTKSFTVLKDTVDATVTGITSVATDINVPYIDPTNNQNTLVKYTASADATTCKWDISNSLSYDAMSHTCESLTDCTLNLEGRGSHTVYFKCLDNHGNKQTANYPLTYAISSSSAQPFGWQQTRVVKIDPATAVNDYQVRVELTSDTFDYDNAKDDGSDIKFYDNQDNKLSYWIEKWNNRGTSILWVKVPNSGTAEINLFYGNFSGTNESSFDDVFGKNYNVNGLVGSWHFDDDLTSATVADNSGNNNTGTLTNGPVWQTTDGGGWANQSDAHFATGHNLSFDGKNDYINVPDSNSLDLTNQWTISAWIKRNYPGTQHSIVEKYQWTSGKGGYYLRIGADNKLYASNVAGTSENFCLSNNWILNDGWHFVTATFDTNTNTIKCYIDGLLENTNASAALDPTSGDSDLKIGAQGNNNAYVMDGNIDEVKIYNRVLNNDEIRAEYERRIYNSNGPTTTLGGVRLSNENFASQSDWFDSVWNYRAQLTIFNNDNTNSLTNYQAVFNLDTKYLVTAGKLLANGNDLRFTDSDGITSLPYFIQSNLNDVNTKIFIKIPEVGANSQKKIFMYYGNSGATAASNENTLEFYDDFNDSTLSSSKWPTQNLGSYITEENGEFKMTGIRGSNYFIQSPAFSTTSIPLMIESSTYTVTAPTSGWSPLSWWQGTNSGMGSMEQADSYTGKQQAWHNSLWVDQGINRPLSESHLNQIVLRGLFNTTVQSEFTHSYYRDWSADYFDNAQNNYYIRLGARPDNYDPGSIEAMDGRIDWVLARKYTDPEPRVGAYKVAYTVKKGTILSETWSQTIYVEEPVVVSPGETLTIMPGTVIKFAPDTYIRLDQANINAIGLSYDPIYFTSVNDDDHGTILDNSNGTPTGGDWMGLYVIGNGNNIMKFCNVAYGGKTHDYNGVTYKGMINVREDDMTIVNTVFNHSQNADIFSYQANPEIYRNNLGDSPYGLYIDANNQVINNPVRDNSFANTTTAAIYVDNLPDTDNNGGPGLVLRNNDIDQTNTGLYIKNMSGASVRDNNAENTVDASQNAFKNQAGYMCYFDNAAGSCKFDRTTGGEILFDTNSVILDAPNGNEHWMAGSTQTINWNFNNGTSNGSYVDIYLSPNSGEEFDFTVAADLKCDGTGSGPGCSGSTGSYNWLVSGVPNNEKRLKIVLRDSGGNSLVEDMSDLNFQINLITDELSNADAGSQSTHTIKFAIPFDWPDLVNDSFKVTFPPEFDLSLTASDISATGGDVTWGNEIVDATNKTIIIPFTGTLNESDGSIIFNIGNSTNSLKNPTQTGSYRITVTDHDNPTGAEPAIHRLSTDVNINNDIAFAFHIPATLQLSIRDINDTVDIDHLRFTNPIVNTINDVSHLIKVATNAHNGYSVTISEDHDLTGAAGAAITNFTGTNESPTAWVSPPGGAINSYYGYHTSDGDLSFGTINRFANPNTWAAITTDPKEISYYPHSTQNQATTMTFRLQFTPKQVAGHYEQTVLYVITPNY